MPGNALMRTFGMTWSMWVPLCLQLFAAGALPRGHAARADGEVSDGSIPGEGVPNCLF